MLRELRASKEIVAGNAHWWNERIVLVQESPNGRAEEFEK